MRERSWFRLAVTGLALVGVLVLYMSLHPRHRPHGDDGTDPRIPTDAPPTTR